MILIHETTNGKYLVTRSLEIMHNLKLQMRPHQRNTTAALFTAVKSGQLSMFLRCVHNSLLSLLAPPPVPSHPI
jgi:hypothetical protein